MKLDMEDAFWAKVNKTDHCWIWTGSLSNGYGMFRGQRAHRVSFFIAYRAIKNGMLICHRCDNPSCVRPDHLFEGTASDNARDAYFKGRMIPPTNNQFQIGNTVNVVGAIPPEQIKEIRKLFAEGKRQKELCTQFGLKRNMIWKIVHGKNYKHLL